MHVSRSNGSSSLLPIFSVQTSIFSETENGLMSCTLMQKLPVLQGNGLLEL